MNHPLHVRVRIDKIIYLFNRSRMRNNISIRLWLVQIRQASKCSGFNFDFLIKKETGIV